MNSKRKIGYLAIAIASLVILIGYSRVTRMDGGVRHSSEASVFEPVINELANKPLVSPKFVGSRVLVTNAYNEGDSLYYSLPEEMEIDPELIDALKAASHSKSKFPDAREFGAHAQLTPDSPLNYLKYFDEKTPAVDGKCFVSFWRPGFSKDNNEAILRVAFGPVSHETVITFILARNDHGWKIIRSEESSYP